MPFASTRLRRLVLALWTLLVAYLSSPLSRWAPALTVAAADDNGLGPGGATAAYNFVFAVSIILAFLFGFGLRDAIHRHSLRAKARTPPKAAPKRA